MRALNRKLAARVALPPGPAETADLFREMERILSAEEFRGRPVQIIEAAFPAGVASGVWLDMTDRDLIVVERNTAPQHKLHILGHELGHMFFAPCQDHSDPAAIAAAQVIGGGTDVDEAVRSAAARTGFDELAEQRAEHFGALFGRQFHRFVEADPHRAPAEGLAGRIDAAFRGKN
ncbi:toxin-antitoxin system, toxin component [Streptomyces sp. NPDC090022]|uniref:toxin-antitoxin system, toxin component n=1 Tax=Streptomyces sp. NPDC090022 TaxID=3365920 RepID=UPI0038069013